jgi:hypothetical protein
MGVHGPAPVEPEYTIWLTDENLTVISQQLDDWSSINVTLRFNEASSGEIVLPAYPDVIAAARTPKARAVIERDGQILLAGPIESSPYQWDAEQHGEDSPGELTIRFADDFALIAGRLTYPNPALAATAQDVAKWTSTANAEVLLRDLVNVNAGPGALTARQIPGLVLGPAAGVGTTITWTSRFQPLADELRGVANSGGRLGFRTQQVGTTIEFQVYAPTDRTGQLWFGRGMDNVRKISHEPEAPKATTAIVGGADAGVNRVIREVSDLAGWWRIETFIDSTGLSNATELDQAGSDELAKQAEVQRLAIEAIDSPGQQYGIDYQLGDIVSVEPYPGLDDVPDVISAVQIDVTADRGETISPIIGVNSAQMLNPAAAQQRDILRALAYRSANVEIPL